MRSLARALQMVGDPRPLAPWLMPLLVIVLAGMTLATSAFIFPARFCDFRAFYCSGRMVLEGHDPYLEHPLHECEHALPGPFLSNLPKEITIPAPYPGYALGVFAIVARLPFNIAVIVWTLSSVAALLTAIVLVTRLTSTPLRATAIVLGFPAAVVALPLGQPTLFVLAAIVACASLLEAARPRWAAAAALVALLDPHVGIVVCAALFAGIPATRIPLLAGLVCLGAFDLCAFGVAREVEYLRDVLPLHALVNVPESSQFSIASFAYAAGLSRSLALSIGTLWYVAAVVGGIFAGLRLRSRYGPVALVFIPLIFAVFGGPHVHLQQLELALPAFLLVTSAARGNVRNWLIIATFCATVPWLVSAASPPQFLTVAVLGVALVRLMSTQRFDLALGTMSFIVLLGLCWAIVQSSGANVPFAAVSHGNPFAEVAWGRFVDASSLPSRTWSLLAKLPTVMAFVSVAVIVAYLAMRPSGRTPVAVLSRGQ